MEAVQGKTGAGRDIDYRGKKVIAAWRYIPSLDWGMVTKIDTKEAFAEITNLRNLMLIILAIVCSLSSVMAFSIAQSISVPIEKLAKGTQIIGSGNLDVQLATNSKDEIGQLSRSFDKMTYYLKTTTASRDELNREIDERKHAEIALRESQADLNRAQAVAHIGSWRLDIRKNILTWSDENHKIFGIPKGTPMTYETFLTAIHPDDRDYVDKKWQAALKGEPYDIEHRIVVEGQLKWVFEKAYLEFTEDGELLGGFGITQDISERKQAEDAIRRSAERFEILSETAGQLLQSKQPQNIVNALCARVMNHLNCHIFINYLVDEQIHRLHLNTFGGITDQTAKKIEWLDFGQAICGCVVRDGKPIIAENIQQSCDARADLVRSFGIRAYACHPIMSQGKVSGTLSFGTKARTTFGPDDLSLMKSVTDQVAVAMERIRAEEQLQKANETLEETVRQRTSELTLTVETLEKTEKIIKSERKRFENVLEMMPAYAVLLTPDYRVAYANHTFREWFGNDNGKKCHEFLFNLAEPCENCQTYNVLKTNKSQFWEWTGPNDHNYDIYDYPFTDTDGSPLIMEIGVDVTAHKQAQEALRASSLYSRSLIESSLNPLVTISADGKITDVNEATVNVTGIPRNNLIGTDFSNYFTQPQKAREGYQQVFAKGFVTDYPLTIRHKNGKLTDVLYNAAVYTDTHGNVIGVFAAARDITERKAAQEKQTFTNSLLELFARKTSRKKYLDATVNVIRQWSGCEFVGIRIKDNQGNIPYESQTGFDKDFLALENAINLERDNCFCIRAIKGHALYQEKKLITAGGAFYCNDSVLSWRDLQPSRQKIIAASA